MVRTAADAGGERRERRMALDVSQVDAGAADLVDPGIGGARVAGRAPAARAESGELGLIGSVEERHDVPARAAAWTRRPAVDARRSHRVHELAVGPPIGPEDRLPAWVVCRLLCVRCHVNHATTMPGARPRPLSASCGQYRL